jgi:acetolactate synthase-1/2/3 large subunit
VIWTTGVGQHQMWAMQYLLCDRPRSFITSGGLGTMGYGVPAASARRPRARTRPSSASTATAASR